MDAILYAIQIDPNFADIDKFMFVTITSDGTRYAFMINDIDAFNNYFYIPTAGNWDQDLNTKKSKNRNDYYYGDIINGVKKEPLIQENSTNKEQDLKYFMEIANSAGLNVFEMDENFNTFTQIKLTNNEIKRTPCN